MPRSFGTIEANLEAHLSGIRCPEHDLPARAELLVDDQGAMQIFPLGCCGELDRLVLAALRRSETIAPPPLPELELESPGLIAEGSST